MRLTRLFLPLLFVLLPALAYAQAVPLQGGPWVSGHAPMYVNDGSSQPVLLDSGNAGGGDVGTGLSEMGLTARGIGTPPYAGAGSGPNGENWCDYDAPITSAGGYHYLCMSPNALGGGLLSYGAAGAATVEPLYISVNGTKFALTGGGVSGPGSSTAGDFACWNDTLGSLLDDCGATVSIAKGGTGQVTANAALNALLPSQTGNSGKVLQTNGTTTSWQTAGGGGSGTVTSVATGAGLTGGPITGTGTISISNAITPGGPVGSATVVPVLTYNAQGELTAVTTANITGTAPGGSASGDLSGTYPGPTVAKVNGATYPSAPSANTVPVVTSATSGGTITYEAVPNAALANSATTVNGQTCTLGSTCTISASAGTITVGTTGISSGTSGNIEYNNAGVLGEKATTGSGNVVLATSPTLVTPALGTPASGVATNLTGTAAGLTAGNVTTNANLTGPITSVGNATAIASQTGTGSKFVVDTSPTLVTPNIGAAAGASLSLSGLTASSAVATDGSKNLVSVANTGTGSNVLATSPTLVTPALGTPSSATLTNATGLPISTGVSGLGTGIATWLGTPSSANLAAALTDETGTGSAVFGTSPTIATPVLNGLPTGTGVASAPTASTLAARDSGGNLIANNEVSGLTSTATAAGTTTLTSASTKTQVFTGSTTQTVILPVTSTLSLGWSYTVINNSSGSITVQSSGGNSILVIAAGNTGNFSVVSTSGTTATSWTFAYISSGAGTGTVTSVAATVPGFLSVSGSPITTAGTLGISYSGTALPVANGGTGVTTGAVVSVKNQTFTSSGTYTPSAGLLYAKIECLGGGGGGGGSNNSTSGSAWSAGGGGSGSYSIGLASAATIGASQTVTIGAAGAAGASTPTAGGNGGDTSVGALCVGKGGTGGGVANSGLGGGGAGGVAGTGNVLTAVGNTGGGGQQQSVVTFGLPPGSGAPSVYGGLAGIGYAVSTTPGRTGATYGAGGNGAVTWNAGGAAVGGAGISGIVIITEYCNQ